VNESHRAPLPSVSVVIPTHNRGERLEQAIRPLLAGPETFQLVVVVDGAAERPVALVERIARDDPRVQPLPIKKSGAMAARLAGAVAASGDVILMLDDDVIAEPHLVAGHARAHAGREGLLVLGYMPVATGPRRPEEFARELYRGEYERTADAWERDPSTILRSLWTGNLSIRRATYVALAGEVEQVVSGYHEDLDFGLRCLEAGLTGVFDRSLRATHAYERDLAGFLRDARSSGRNLPVVHRRHSNVIGQLRPDFAWRGAPAPLRPLARVGIRLRALRMLARAGVFAAGSLRLYTLQRHGAGLLWRMEQGHAALESRQP
jgi:glycosyltransferase involved in cell wall biosynthesis